MNNSGIRSGDYQSHRKFMVFRLILRFWRPFIQVESWIIPTLVFGSLGALIYSVETANWVTTPSLTLVMILAILTALIISKFRAPTAMSVFFGIGIGVVVVYWNISTLSEAEEWLEKFDEINRRLDLWWTAALTDEIANDTIPVALIITSLIWSISYITAWIIFRHKKLWFGLLPSGLALSTNLSYLPNQSPLALYLYLFFAMLLATHLHSLQTIQTWIGHQSTIPRNYSRSVLLYSFLFCIVVLLVANALPMHTPVIDSMKKAWNDMRWPVIQLQNEFGRVFAGVSSQKVNSYPKVQEHLPFTGPISTTQTELYQFETSVPSYWRVQVFPEYTGKGWKQGDVEKVESSLSPSFSPNQTNQTEKELNYQVTFLRPSKILPMASFETKTEQLFQFSIKSYPIHTINVNPESPHEVARPPELNAFYDELGNILSSPDNSRPTGARIIDSLPENWLVISVAFTNSADDTTTVIKLEETNGTNYLTDLEDAFRAGQDTLLAIQLQYIGAEYVDVLSASNTSYNKTGSSNTITSHLPVANITELKTAGNDYPSWITNTYLQLPNSLPHRVKQLANDLTSSSPTAFGKVSAIQEYLKGLTYDQNITAPSYEADGVDHFLFNEQRGYSTYFASSLVVLVRSTGIPARLVTGFTIGDWDSVNKTTVVRDLHRHAWAEVYFPNYGWIEFEATPGFEVTPETIRATEELTAHKGISEGDIEFEEDTGWMTGSENLQIISSKNPRSSYSLSNVLKIVLLIGSSVVCVTIWKFRKKISNQNNRSHPFTRMVQFAHSTGLTTHSAYTPLEYGRFLSGYLPNVQKQIQLIAEHYIKVVYSSNINPTKDSQEANSAWKQVRYALITQFIQRTILMPKKLIRPIIDILTPR